MGRQQLEAVYGLHLPVPGRGQDPKRCERGMGQHQLHQPRRLRALRHGSYPRFPPTDCDCFLRAAYSLHGRPPTAVELLRSFAYARGWVAASGLPDETRAGRRILKDYVDGKILYCKAPPGASPQVLALAAAAGQRHRPSGTAAGAGAAAPPPQRQQQLEDGFGQDGGAQQGAAVAEAGPPSADGAGAVEATSGGSEEAAPQVGPVVLDLDEGDLLLMDDLNIGDRKAKAQRPAYKVSGRGAAGQGRAAGSLGVRAVSFGLAGVVGAELV